MDTSATTFCKFSPLRTPHMKRKHSKKHDSPRKEVSDTDTDVQRIAKSVSDRLIESSKYGVMSSDDDLFISQSKKTSKKLHSDNVSGYTKHVFDTNAGLDSESERSTDAELVSPKKRRKIETQEISAKKKTQINSPVKSQVRSPKKSEVKSRKRVKDHDISDSDSDSAPSPAADSRKVRSSVSSVSSVLTSSTDSSDGGRKSKSDSSDRGRIRKSDKAASDSLRKRTERESSSSVSDISSSDSESDARSRKNGIQHQNVKNLQQNCMSEDSDFDTRPKKKSSKKSKPVENEPSSTSKNDSKLRYKIPEGFEIDTSQKYLSKAEIQGKQLWLITTPSDFDIANLHKQKIKMPGNSVVCTETEEAEKQYEVVARSLTSQVSSYNSVALATSDSEEFTIGSEICGQIQVMDWIPVLPSVELVRPPPIKHRVPDDLKPTFKPFGSESPTRQNDHNMDVVKKEKHKKKKKKKDKKKE